MLVHRFTSKPYAVLAPKDNPQLVVELHDIHASGEYDWIHAKWFEPYGGSAMR